MAPGEKAFLEGLFRFLRGVSLRTQSRKKKQERFVPPPGVPPQHPHAEVPPPRARGGPSLTVAGPQAGPHAGALADQDGEAGVGLLQGHVVLLDELPADGTGGP